MKRSIVKLAILVLVSAVLVRERVSAQDMFWTGAANATWSNGANWIPAGPPGTNNTAVFNNVAPSNQPTVTAAASVGALRLETSPAITVNSGIALAVSGGTADIGGPGGFTKQGPGTLQFRRAVSPSFAGDVAIPGGRVEHLLGGIGASADYSFGGGDLRLDGGTFRFAQGTSAYVATLLNDFVILSGGGTLNTDRDGGGNPQHVFSGAFDLRGNLTLSKGGGGNNELSSKITGPVRLDGGDRTITADASFANGAYAALAGAVADDGFSRRLTLRSLTGDRRFLISGPAAGNTWSGGTTIASGGGFIEVASTSGLGSGGLTVEAGGRVRLLGAGNLVPAAETVVNGNTTSLGVLGLGFNGLPNIRPESSGVIAIETAGFTVITNMATLGDGTMRLGSIGAGTYARAFLEPATNGLYRLGGGGGTLTVSQSNTFTGAVNRVEIGETRVHGFGTVTIAAAQSHGGGTTVNPTSTVKQQDNRSLGPPGSSIRLVGSGAGPADVWVLHSNHSESNHYEVVAGTGRLLMNTGGTDNGYFAGSFTIASNAVLQLGPAGNIGGKGIYNLSRAPTGPVGTRITGPGRVFCGGTSGGSLSYYYLWGDNDFAGGVSLSVGAGGSGGFYVGIGHDHALGAGTFTVSANNVCQGIRALDAPRRVPNALSIAGLFRIDGSQPLTFTGDAVIGTADATVVVNNTALTTLAGDITQSGTRGLIKQGNGVLALDGTASYTGATTVEAGCLLVNGMLTPGGAAATVARSGTLGGTGSVGRAVSVYGSVAPGAGADAAGTLAIEGNLDFRTNSTFAVEVGGALPGDGAGFYDRLNVTGTNSVVSLSSNVTLSVSAVDGSRLTGQETFYILTRADEAKFAGTFIGLPEGSLVAVSNETYRLTYRAHWRGSQAASRASGGNDIALITLRTPGTILAVE